MGLILYAIPAFVFFVLVEAWISHRRGLGVYRLHDAITSLNIGLMSEVFRGMQKLVTVLIYAVVVDKVGVFAFDTTSPVVWVLAFVLYDFFYYWAHRAGHEVNLIWAAHVVHHSSEEFNLSTALRQSSTNTATYWIFYLPMAVLGIPATVFTVTLLLSALYQYWIHTRLIGKLGWFEWVFNTPSHHRVHHGQNEYCIDRNYGATFIVWDRLFGTFAEEREDEPVVYGALTPLHSWNPVWANFKNYIGIAQGVARLPGWRNKLLHVFAPPGWTPQDGTPEAPPPLRFEAATFRRFETASTGWQQAYGVLACGITLLLLVHWLVLGAALPVHLRAAYGAVIILNVTCIGWVLASARRALVLEAARVVAAFGALAAGQWFGPVAPWAQALAVVGLVASLALLWQVHRTGTSGLGAEGGQA